MNDTGSALKRALHKVLKALVRLLLRQGVAYTEFADMAKQAYVDVANEDFAVPGRKQSMTRISVLTGIHRHEVGRLLRREAEDDTHLLRHNRAARVISGWLNDPDFSAEGKARDLPIETGFAELVARHGADVTVRAILDELERVDAVTRLDNDLVRLDVRAFTPGNSMEDLVFIFGDSVADLLQTLDHNLSADVNERRLQLSVVYSNLPDEVLKNIELISRDRAMEFLTSLNDFFATQDRDSNPAVQGQGRNRAGIGLYYFQHPVRDEDTH